ncbi:MAG TPA: TetR/AcrR family transcriptional regulator [Nitrolancea sp.]|nr:TetR/AcrR family transcriptional regulator [Nitrolancea sp.]
MASKKDDRSPLIWTRIGQSSRGRQPSLTHQQIAEAAVKIADEGGLDAVSMRKVARALDVGTMSLYRYVGSRDDLIDLMNDCVMAELLVEPFDASSWRMTLHDLAWALRRLYLRHEWTVESFGGRPALGPNSTTLYEHALAAIDRPGMTIDQLMDMLSTVWAFTHGVAHGEIIALQSQRVTGMGDLEWREAAAPLVLKMIEGEAHPYFRRIVIEAEDFPDPDVVFERRLGYVLDGLAVGLGLDG